MKLIMGAKVRVVLPVAAGAVVFGIGVMVGQTPESPHAGWTPPTEAQRCPSKWGANDTRGSANHMGPETVLRATRLIRTGETFELGFELNRDMPLISNRRWDLQINYSGRVREPLQIGGLTETLFTSPGQVGTQLDGFAHQLIGDSFYNCFKLNDVANAHGIDKLGVQNIGTLMTRGVLIDVAALKGVDVLGDTYVITPQDLQQALARQNLTLQPGDAAIVRTGWGKYWTEDRVRYLRSSPGLGIAAEEWLVSQDPMLVAADNCCIEVRPVGVRPLIHTFLLVVHGVLVIENMRLDELAASGVDEFALVVQPLKMWGATGATVAPTAIR